MSQYPPHHSGRHQTTRPQNYYPPQQPYPVYAAPAAGASAMKIGVIAGLVIALLATVAVVGGFVRFAPEAEADQAQLVQVPGDGQVGQNLQNVEPAQNTPAGDQTPPVQPEEPAAAQDTTQDDDPAPATDGAEDDEEDEVEAQADAQPNATVPAPTPEPDPTPAPTPAPAPTEAPAPPAAAPAQIAPAPEPYKPAPVKPEKIFCNISDTDLFVGETTVFTASHKPAHAEVKYSFDHGDGTVDHRNPSHAYYAHPGTYTVKVTAKYGHNEHFTVNCGKVVVKQKHVTPPHVQVHCSISNTHLKVGETTTFTGSHNAPAHSNVNIWFDHGDGTVDHRNPSHAYYAHPGKYTVTMFWQIDHGQTHHLVCGHVNVTPKVYGP